MAQVHIIKASAGSGKTFSLTGFYLSLIVNEPLNYYRHILAVTFTNKATAEMKSRILEELYLLGSNQQSDQLAGLIQFTGKDEATIRDKARALLNCILHGYSWFSVVTIDSFFQGVIRSFVHELGIPGNYSLQIDNNLVLDEAIDKLIANLGQEPQITKWLVDYIENRLDEGKSWIIKQNLKKIGFDLFKEKIFGKINYLDEKLSDIKSINEYRSNLYAIKTGFENKLTSIASKAISTISTAGYSIEDFAHGTSGAAGYLLKVSNKIFEKPSSRTLEVLEKSDKWAAKTSARRNELIRLGNEQLNKHIQSIIDAFDANGKFYYTANSVLKNLHQLGLLYSLSIEIANIRKEKGLFLISDSTPFINKIINNNDAPFIYEKIGTRFNHILIDEFQDTSDMQWENFKPLVSNSLSEDNDCLLVGDIKQSIYRWRNSNWEILDKKVKKEFSKNVISEQVLEYNRRSDAHIINFNNYFFQEIPSLLNNPEAPENESWQRVDSVYKECFQKIPAKNRSDSGYVSIKLFDKKAKDDSGEYYGKDLIEKINEMLSCGFLPGDIAILTRNKAEGTVLAKFLVAASKDKKFTSEVGVISNESLFLNSSSAVKLLLAAFKYVLNPSDKIAAASLVSRYLNLYIAPGESQFCFPSGCFEYEMIDKHIQSGFNGICLQLRSENLYLIATRLSVLLKLNTISQEKVYLHSFIDKVFQYSTSELSDLNGFLNYWEDEGQKQTISAAESEGAVKILTIHKSKGLQFPVVILPFADWSIKPKPNEILWVEPESEPFNALELVPVSINNSLADGCFANDFQQEKLRTLIDNLNLLYVAFTRPENALIVFSVAGNEDISTMGDLIKKNLASIAQHETLQLKPEEDKNTYLLKGTIIPNRKKSKIQMDSLGEDSYARTLPDIAISTQSVNFNRQDQNSIDPAFQGRIMHSIMENVRILSDLKKSIQRIVVQGIISVSEGQSLEKNLENTLRNENVKDWFSENYTILTEANIIGISGESRRPDRVMLKDNKAVVVDYKFGKEVSDGRNTMQMEQYIGLLREMGYSEVQGFIWYVNENNLEEVRI
jgi:ATP-dependent helicase/nuclease subunit A